MTDVTNLPMPTPAAPGVAPGQPAPPPPEPLTFTDTRGRPSSETEQAISMAADLVKHGADPERVKKAMAADGYTFAPDNRSKSEVAFDDAFGPPRAADGYKIGWTGRLPADADPIAAQELDTAARTWLHSMSFPVEVGNSLAEMVFDAARANADRTPQQRQEWKAEQDRILLKFARGEAGAEEARKIANQVLEFAPAEITNAFRDAGALDDAAVIVQLSLQGKRMAHRIGLQK